MNALAGTYSMSGAKWMVSSVFVCLLRHAAGRVCLDTEEDGSKRIYLPYWAVRPYRQVPKETPTSVLDSLWWLPSIRTILNSSAKGKARS